MSQLNLRLGIPGKEMLYTLLVVVSLLIIPFQSQAQSGNGMYDAISAGSFSSCGGNSFSDYQNTYYNYDNYNYNNGQPSPDVWYTFTVGDYTDIELSLCGSNFDTYLHLLDENGNEMTSNDDSYECGNSSYISYYGLSSGTYYLVVEGSGYDAGDFSLTINSLSSGGAVQGATMYYPVYAGTFSTSGSFSDTMNNGDPCLGDDYGQGNNDIYYQFTINNPAAVTISHCGTNFDSYVHLLNNSGGLITYDDDGSPCYSMEPYIQVSLQPGTYYVVSEGYGSNTGNIVTNIEVSMLSIAYSGGPQTFAVGTPVSPLSLTVSGGTLAFDNQATSTLAGNGNIGFQDGPGSSATFYRPLSTAVDASGNVYVADSDNERVRKITPAGVVSTLAGNGTKGAANGTGTSATFRHPAALAVDASGNIYVGDQQNHMIRKITHSGTVTTFAGSGAAGAADGIGTGASFNNPIGLAFDPTGNLYVADYGNHKIRKITPQGVVSTFAGTGAMGATNGPASSATFKNPMGVAIDANGNLYIGDRMNYMVRKVTPSGIVSTLAGSGVAGYANGIGTSASFSVANSVAVDASGNVYVADQSNNMIRKVTPSGEVSTLAGTLSSGSADGTGTQVSLNNPYGLCIDPQGTLYIADYNNQKIRKMVTRAFSISPALPAGLVFNSTNGTISGTPSAISSTTNYTITAYNGIQTTLNITIIPGSFSPSQDQNYVLAHTPREEGINSDAALAGAIHDKDRVQSSIEYFDGLGRPAQSIQIKGSPDGKDIITPKEYDLYGREVKQYLPYADVNGTTYGSYKLSAIGNQAFFYDIPPSGIVRIAMTNAGEGPTFAETKFEPSALNRVVEQGAPGALWQLSEGHTLKTGYGTNGGTEVLRWTISGNTCSATSLYGANQLFKTIIKDENWTSGQTHLEAGTAEEFKDKEGRVVLKRTFNHNTANNTLETLSIYYVYDDFGNLRYVILPGFTGTSFTEGDSEFNKYVYAYHHDHRNRLIEKKLPAKGWEYMLYNNLDNMVASQDANQRTRNEWEITKYDAHGRTILTGIWNNNNTAISREDAQTLVNQNTTHYWETRVPGYEYTSLAWPSVYSSSLIINYYDNYAVPGLPSQYHFSGSTKTKGLVTAVKTSVLNTADMLWNINYYDDKGRVIKAFKQHYLGGVLNAYSYDEVTNEYSFTNEIEWSERKHFNANNTSTPAVTVKDTYTYDHVGRKTETWQEINGGTPVLLSKTEYNAIGQAKTKHLHSTASSGPFLQDIDYSYNERGWLRTISGNTRFSLDLRYENPSTGMPQYNGNVSQQFYTGDYSGSRNFQYTYDKLNRITDAISSNGNLNESLTYDKMGNVLSLNRTGAGYSSLTYTYHGGQSHQLASVSGTGFTTRNYQYDGNGNAMSDGMNKTIEYNLLNLPFVVKEGSSTIANYIYTAAGIKVRNIGSDGSWDYINGIHYKNGQIEFIQTAEGKAISNGSSYQYVYNLRDHLGNVRVSVDQYNNQVRVVQEDEYYAFGLQKGLYNYSNNNRYLYNGKEKQIDLENQYDYGARFYDPVIARFTTEDPHAENYYSYSPYVYVGNNPLRRTDPTGMDWVDDIRKKVAKVYGETKVSAAKTYNEAKTKTTTAYNKAKTSATQAYNQTVKAASAAKDKAVTATTQAAKAGQTWVKENKTALVQGAKNMQTVGDVTQKAGYIAAIAGSAGGITAAPGLGVAATGAAINLTGKLVEWGVEAISPDQNKGSQAPQVITEIGVQAAGAVAGAVVDRSFPGMGQEANSLIKESHNILLDLVKPDPGK